MRSARLFAANADTVKRLVEEDEDTTETHPLSEAEATRVLGEVGR